MRLTEIWSYFGRIFENRSYLLWSKLKFRSYYGRILTQKSVVFWSYFRYFWSYWFFGHTENDISTTGPLILWSLVLLVQVPYFFDIINKGNKNFRWNTFSLLLDSLWRDLLGWQCYVHSKALILAIGQGLILPKI